MSVHQVLIGGAWRKSSGESTFHAVNPQTRMVLEGTYPVSPWSEIEEAVRHAAEAAAEVREWPGERFAAFLDRYVAEIEARQAEIVRVANEETALPVEPRLANVEMPRTLNQLRLAAQAAREGSWALPTIDTKANIRSVLAPIGPVVVFGPNNFPLAYNGIAGGDFAAAIAVGNPVIAKGHSAHPETTRLLAEAAHIAAEATGMPAGFVQLIYRTSHDDGAKLISHPLIGACGYTGSRHGGLFLKHAADDAGKPIYLEMSSINPVFLLPGAMEERGAALVDEFIASSLAATGQFCTNPGLVVLKEGDAASAFIAEVAKRYDAQSPGTLLGGGVEKSLQAGIAALRQAGAERVTSSVDSDEARFCHPNTLLRVPAAVFLANPLRLQEEAFGNASLFVVVETDDQFAAIVRSLEGNLTGSLYTAKNGRDDALYDIIAPELRTKVGRLLNDKMPTGVAVSPAMNHGGPYPATGHPGFTAVGIPAALRRFAQLQCYDNVRPHRLPPLLKNENIAGSTWRLIDDEWTQRAIG